METEKIRMKRSENIRRIISRMVKKIKNEYQPEKIIFFILIPGKNKQLKLILLMK